jgi:flagellar motor switch protein FliM
MLRRFMEWIQADLNAVWTSSSHSALTIGDPHPRKAATSAGSGAQRVVLQPFSVRMEGQESELALIIPLSLLVGVEALANGHDAERESNWQRAMGRALWETPLTLTAYLAQIRLTVGELLALRSGDILPLEEPNRVAIYLEDRPLMAGETGIRNGRKVVRLAHRDVSRNETVMGAKA